MGVCTPPRFCKTPKLCCLAGADLGAVMQWLELFSFPRAQLVSGWYGVPRGCAVVTWGRGQQAVHGLTAFFFKKAMARGAAGVQELTLPHREEGPVSVIQRFSTRVSKHPGVPLDLLMGEGRYAAKLSG